MSFNELPRRHYGAICALTAKAEAEQEDEMK